MIKVEFNKKSNNPFYGLKNCLNLTQAVTTNIPVSLLNEAWNEVKDSKEKREMFFSLLFSIGDITARQHNIFKGTKRDSGGNANRDGFYTIFNWLRDYHKEQFAKFLNAGLFNEYQCFDTLFRSRVKTKCSKVIKVYDCFGNKPYTEILLQYVYKVINGNNPFNKLLVAKFLTPPRLSKRSGHNKILPETLEVMKHKALFLIQLSKLMGWEIRNNFKGYREWRKQYNGELESVLFSTGKINEFDKVQFLEWFDKLPAQARFRVKNRILYSKTENCKLNTLEGLGNKWSKFQPWIKEWESNKEKKQTEQRILEEKVRQNQASEEDKARLQKVKKEAKVNVGATNFKELYQEILNGRVDKLKLESFIQNKVNLPYNTLVLIDDSGSMNGGPFNFASFLAAVCLTKNPDDDGRNLLGFFGISGRWFSYIDKEAENSPNSIIRRKVAKSIIKPFVDPTKSFLENYINIDKFCKATYQGGYTDIRTILNNLKETMNTNPEVLDALKNYPVWTVLSDGEFNSMSSPEASFNDFFRVCEQTLGFKPFVICMDITNSAGESNIFQNRGVEKFSGIDNLMYIPSNPAQIEQFLTNFKDMDIFDVYTPLQSLYRSNRYIEVRENTL